MVACGRKSERASSESRARRVISKTVSQSRSEIQYQAFCISCSSIFSLPFWTLYFKDLYFYDLNRPEINKWTWHLNNVIGFKWSHETIEDEKVKIRLESATNSLLYICVCTWKILFRCLCNWFDDCEEVGHV